MVQIFPTILLPIVALVSQVFAVHWSSNERHALTIVSEVFRSSVTECVESGREGKIRFEMQLCRGLSGWFDPCAEARTESHSIVYDSITESYRVSSDRLSDEAGPSTVGIPSKEEAISEMVTISDLSLSFLGRGDLFLLNHDRRYFQIRGEFQCKGAVNKTFASLSEILTLGLVDVVKTDTGWLDFNLFDTNLDAKREE